MKRVLTNDRVLLMPRSGVRVYLEQVIAHWPDRPTVELVGMLTQVLWRRRSMPASRFAFPDVESLDPIRLQPLLTILSHTEGLRARAVRRLRPLLYATDGLLTHGISRSARYSGFFEPNHIPLANLQPTVTTIHDLSVLEMPHFHPRQRVAYWRRRLKRTVQVTTHWVCVSEATAAALKRVLGIDRDRITVIPLASRWADPPASWTPTRIRRALGLPDRYVVCLGTIEPRKNTIRLLDAYARLGSGRRRHLSLILAGSSGWGDAEFWESLRQHPMARNVLCTGYLSDAQAAAVVAAARAMVFPSVYEGFGLPPLEAMCLGVPAVISTAPSLVEVCGDAALQLDPDDSDAWAQAMDALSSEGDERAAMIEQATDRAAAFSWRATAQCHHDLLDRLTGR